LLAGAGTALNWNAGPLVRRSVETFTSALEIAVSINRQALTDN
jgi:hypothetical protein